jgi:hypothetical protein
MHIRESLYAAMICANAVPFPASCRLRHGSASFGIEIAIALSAD